MSKEVQEHSPITLDFSDRVQRLLDLGTDGFLYKKALEKDQKEAESIYSYEGFKSSDTLESRILNGLTRNLSSIVRSRGEVIFEDDEYKDWKFTDPEGTEVVVNQFGTGKHEEITLSMISGIPGIRTELRLISDKTSSSGVMQLSSYSITLENTLTNEDDYNSGKIKTRNLYEEHAEIIMPALHNFNVLNSVRELNPNLPQDLHGQIPLEASAPEDFTTAYKQKGRESMLVTKTDIGLIGLGIDKIFELCKSSDQVEKYEVWDFIKIKTGYSHPEFNIQALLSCARQIEAVSLTVVAENEEQGAGKSFTIINGENRYLLTESGISTRSECEQMTMADADRALGIIMEIYKRLKTEKVSKNR